MPRGLDDADRVQIPAMTQWPIDRDCRDAPVTVLARHSVRPGQEPLFNQWSRGITEVCKEFDGYLGTEIIRPRTLELAGADREFVTIFRFDNDDHLRLWMDSEVRTQWLARTHEFSDQAPQVDYHSLEHWFPPDRHSGRMPSNHKMAIVTFLALWPLVHFIPVATSRFVASSLWIEVISLAAIVALMTYLVMPVVTRVLARWLSPE